MSEPCFRYFRQRVYGLTLGTVHVGYEYSSCKDVIWEVQTTQLSGHDMSISQIGGWNLDIHNRYNFHEGKPPIPYYNFRFPENFH